MLRFVAWVSLLAQFPSLFKVPLFLAAFWVSVTFGLKIDFRL